jgi:hypothetical protein
MDRIRDVLPDNLWRTMLRKLGREEALRLVWTTVVGPRLAGQIKLLRLRGTTLVISVPDAEWTRSLQPLEKMIVDAVNRFPDTWRAEAVELVADTRPQSAVVWKRMQSTLEGAATDSFNGSEPICSSRSDRAGK